MTADERIEAEVTFRSSLVAPWLRGYMAFTDRRIFGEVPTTFLAIPVGKRSISQPLPNVASVTTESGVRMSKVITGLLWLLIALALATAFEQWALSGIALFISATMLGSLYEVTFVVMDTSGSGQVAPVSLLDREEVGAFASTVHAKLAQVTSSPNQMPASADPGGISGGQSVQLDVEERLNRLDRLRASGAISEDEYQRRRQVVVDEL